MWKKDSTRKPWTQEVFQHLIIKEHLGPSAYLRACVALRRVKMVLKVRDPGLPSDGAPPRTHARAERGGSAEAKGSRELEGPLRPSFSSGAPPPRAVGTRAAIRGACVRVKRFCDPAVPPGGPRAALCSCRTETPFGETLGWPARRRLAGVLCCPCGELAPRSAAARRSLPLDPIARSPARLKHCSGAPRGAGGAHCTAKAMICPRSAEATPARSPCALACGQLPP